MRLIMAFLLSMASTQVLAADLNAGEIQRKLIGNAISWWENDGWLAGNLVLMPDGRAVITVDSPMPAKDVGNWSFQGNQLCTTWSEMRERVSKCYSIQKIDEFRFSTSGGNIFELRVAGA